VAAGLGLPDADGHLRECGPGRRVGRYGLPQASDPAMALGENVAKAQDRLSGAIKNYLMTASASIKATNRWEQSA
jgi:hypothetical protein